MPSEDAARCSVIEGAPVGESPPSKPSDGPPAAAPCRVLVVDDHELVREGLVALIGRREDFEIVAQADTVAAAIEAARASRPDLVVMDVRLPDGSGIEATREMRAERPTMRVVMLTGYADEDAVFASIVAGASGYLLKQLRGNDLLAALECVCRDQSLLDPAVTAKVFDRVRRLTSGETLDPVARLTRQEQQILLRIAQGKTNKEIASELTLAEKTVKECVSSLLGKLGLQRRAQAAAFAVSHRLPEAE